MAARAMAVSLGTSPEAPFIPVSQQPSAQIGAAWWAADATVSAASCVEQAQPQPQPVFFGRYEIRTLLGFGGMGIVYGGFDPLLRRDVAVKVMSSSLSGDAGLRRRFEREAQIGAAVRDPRVMGVHDVGTQDSAPYVVLELIEGSSLQKYLLSGPLPTREVARIGRELASGLAAIHRAGFVHRDLKPSNVMITPAGAIKIVDFGLAAPSGTSETDAPSCSDAAVPGAILGTVRYMSPEQARGETLDARSDQFSLGVLLYEAASGRNPFTRGSLQATIAAILVHEPPPPSADRRLNAIIERCLAKNPARRFDDLGDLGQLARSARF
jgi:serine/threonine protein kinase